MRKMYSKEQVANIAGNINTINPGGKRGKLTIMGETEFQDEVTLKTNMLNLDDQLTVMGSNGSLIIEVPVSIDAEGSDLNIYADGVNVNTNLYVDSDYEFTADRGQFGGLTCEGDEDGHTVYFNTERIYMGDLPTSDPEEEGYLWNDNGVLKISQG